MNVSACIQSNEIGMKESKALRIGMKESKVIYMRATRKENIMKESKG